MSKTVKWILFGLVGLIVVLVLAIESEPGSVTQLVPKPDTNAFVCICKCQPVWSDGQVSCNWLATTVNTSCGFTSEVGRAATSLEFPLSPVELVAETT